MPTYAWLYRSTLLLLFVCAAHSPALAVDSAGPAVATAVPIVRVTVENPREINVGKEANFLIVVSNEGQTTTNEVMVVTTMPQHVELARATPEPSEVDGNIVTFRVGSLAPGTKRRINLIAIPRSVRPINMKARTSFETSTQSIVLVRQPVLNLVAKVLPEVGIGMEVDWLIRVTNTGDGRANDVVVTPQLIEGVVQGSSLAQPVKIGSLKPGESKEVQFTVVPTRRGKLVAKFLGTNPDGLEVTQESSFQVLQAGLAIAAAGPAVQPLAREGDYEIRVTNPGDAPTGSTMVVVKIPAGLEVTAAAKNSYDPSTRTLRWRITRIRPSDIVKLPFRAETTAAGDQTLQAIAQAREIDEATTTHTTSVISRSNLIVTVVNDQELAKIADPVGFKVNIINAGSRLVDDLQVRVAMPDGLKAVDSPDYKVTDREIAFPMQKLASGEKVTLAFKAIGNRVGEHRVRVLVNGGALTRELTFEGSTYCYSTDAVPVKSSQPNKLPTFID